MTKALVIEIIPSLSNPWHGRGLHEFHATPHKGDFVEFNNADGNGELFEVVAVIHADSAPAIDVYITRRGITATVKGEWEKSLKQVA